MTEIAVTDSENNPLIDEADQAPAGHISMFIDVPLSRRAAIQKIGHFSNNQCI